MLGPFVFCAGVGWVLGNRAECRCGYPPFVSAGNVQCECTDFTLIERVIGTEWKGKAKKGGDLKSSGRNLRCTLRLIVSLQSELDYESTSFTLGSVVEQ